MLITGITGFVGSHLAEVATARGLDVQGLALEAPPHANLAAVSGTLTLHRADITDAQAVEEVLASAQPDAVVHLAGQAVPSLAARDPMDAVRVNVVGTAAIATALRRRPGARLVFASSADVYGSPAGGLASEDAPLRPANAYAATKVLAEGVVRELGLAGEVAVTIIRPVAQVGPRQHPLLAASAFARQIALAEAGRVEPVIRHGRLDSRRDLVDVRDMATAYLAALDLAPEPTAVFNVGSGRAVAVESVLSMLVGMARVPVTTELDPSLVRPGDAPALAVDASLFRSRTGWEPRIPLERSLRDTLDHWRAAVAGEALARA